MLLLLLLPQCAHDPRVKAAWAMERGGQQRGRLRPYRAAKHRSRGSRSGGRREACAGGKAVGALPCCGSSRCGRHSRHSSLHLLLLLLDLSGCSQGGCVRCCGQARVARHSHACATCSRGRPLSQRGSKKGLLVRYLLLLLLHARRGCRYSVVELPARCASKASLLLPRLLLSWLLLGLLPLALPLLLLRPRGSKGSHVMMQEGSSGRRGPQLDMWVCSGHLLLRLLVEAAAGCNAGAQRRHEGI